MFYYLGVSPAEGLMKVKQGITDYLSSYRAVYNYRDINNFIANMKINIGLPTYVGGCSVIVTSDTGDIIYSLNSKCDCTDSGTLTAEYSYGFRSEAYYCVSYIRKTLGGIEGLDSESICEDIKDKLKSYLNAGFGLSVTPTAFKVVSGVV